MRILAVIALIAFATCGQKDNTDKMRDAVQMDVDKGDVSGMDFDNRVVTFTATVHKIEIIAHSVKFWPMHADPRYALTLAIDDVDHENFPFQPGSAYVLGIHSPSQLQISEGDVGTAVRFRVDWKSTPDGHRFSALRRHHGS